MKAITKLIEKLENPNKVVIFGIDYFEGLRFKEICYNSNEHVVEIVVDGFTIKVDLQQAWVIGNPPEHNVFRDSLIDINGTPRVALKDEFHKNLLRHIESYTPELYFKLAPTKKLDSKAYRVIDVQLGKDFITCHFINISSDKREFSIAIKKGWFEIEHFDGVEPFYIYNYFGCAPKSKMNSAILTLFLKLYKYSLQNQLDFEAEAFTKLLLEISK